MYFKIKKAIGNGLYEGTMYSFNSDQEFPAIMQSFNGSMRAWRKENYAEEKDAEFFDSDFMNFDDLWAEQERKITVNYGADVLGWVVFMEGNTWEKGRRHPKDKNKEKLFDVICDLLEV